MLLFRWEEDNNAGIDHEYNSPDRKLIHFLRQQSKEERKGKILVWTITCNDSAESKNVNTDSMNVQPPSLYDFEITGSDLADACHT